MVSDKATLYRRISFSFVLRLAPHYSNKQKLEVHSTVAPRISHLFFADDSLIFGKASQGEVETVKNIINLYSGASGQMVNFDKSEMTFSKSFPLETQIALGDICGVKIVCKHVVYLGLPASVGHSKKEIFRSIEERVAKKLKSWKVTYLSQAGKLTLIKSVAQSIPSYVMSCFLLPKATIHRLDQIIANFWRG